MATSRGTVLADLRATRSYISMQFLRSQASQTSWFSIQNKYGHLIVCSPLIHTQSFHKMRSTALNTLFFALFALSFSGLLLRSTY